MENKYKKIQEKNMEINNNEFYKVIGEIILCIILSCFFGYIGYAYCVDNNYDVAKGIVFGALFPFVWLTVDKLWDIGFIGYIVLVIIWILICEYIPWLIGIIVFALIVARCIWEIKNAYNNRKTTAYKNELKPPPTHPVKLNNSKYYEKKEEAPSSNYTKGHSTNLNYYDNENTDIELEKEEYHCERCDERISEEEYIENCGLCEDCDAEVYFGERYDGDDYDLYR